MTILNLTDFDVLLFDCYGTLIDWETGILAALNPIFESHQLSVDDSEALETFAKLEAAAERGGYRPYRTILKDVLSGFGEKYGFKPSLEEYASFSGSVRDWPPFGDSSAALKNLKERYKLAVLSNIDDDLFACSAKLLGIHFDHVFTAQTIGSYKPDLRNFEYALANLGLPKKQILHVAQSLFHDIEPASRIGLATVWINRRKNKFGSGATPPAQTKPDMEYPDLASFATLATGN